MKLYNKSERRKISDEKMSKSKKSQNGNQNEMYSLVWENVRTEKFRKIPKLNSNDFLFIKL